MTYNMNLKKEKYKMVIQYDFNYVNIDVSQEA